jgi:phosphoglycolate phosphatase
MQLMFDLDGTLTDSREGVTRCIQQALEEAGIAPPPIEDLTRYVGPPLPVSLATLLGTSDIQLVERAIAAYRRRFEQVGMFEKTCTVPRATAWARWLSHGGTATVKSSRRLSQIAS